jgi:lipopolysaccharide export system permease protein
MTKTLFRYMLMEVLGPFLIGVVVLTFVLLMFQLLKLTELIVSYGVEFSDVGRILVYIFPSFFVFTIPMSFLLAVLLAVSRLSSESELTAMKAGGVSLYQLYPPVLLLSIVMTLITGWLTLFGDPWGKSSFKKMLYVMGRDKATVGLVEHVFNDSLKDMTLYVRHIVPQQGKLEGVFLADERQPGTPLIVVARTGRVADSGQEGQMLLEFSEGVGHRIDPKAPEAYETVQFQRYRVRVDMKLEGSDQTEETYLDKGMFQLGEHVRQLQSQGDSFEMRRAWVEYHRRFAMPFACLAFGLIALPLGISPPRSGRSRGFTVAVVALCIFYLLFRAGEDLGWKGVLHPIVAMWTPIAAILLFGAYLLVKKTREEPIWLMEFGGDLLSRAGQWARRKLGLDHAGARR